MSTSSVLRSCALRCSPPVAEPSTASVSGGNSARAGLAPVERESMLVELVERPHKKPLRESLGGGV